MTTHKDKVREVDLFVKNNKDKITNGFYRPNYHFSTPVGWLNDPNGFIYFRGEYHLFYQFYPYKPQWGSMHWGHVKSKDLVTWEELPTALSPSEWYDDHEAGGCFSGTTIEKDGKLFAFYTGTSFQNGEFVQTQCLATSEDGINFEKYENNPIVKNSTPNVKNDMFRDPKVWEKDGMYYMIIGVSISNKGNAMLYQSADLYNWELRGPLVSYDNDLGTMWECPDIFDLDNKTVLIFSPMGYSEKTTVYLIGELNYKTGQFEFEKEGRLDFGYDYYAPQTTIDNKNRRLVVAWQNGWAWMPWWKDFGPTEIDGWCGSMSLPKVMRLDKENNLCLFPIEELKKYEADILLFKDKKTNQKKQLLTNQVNESFVLKVYRNPNVDFKLIISTLNGDSDEITLENDSIVYNADKNTFGKAECRMHLNKNVEFIEIYSDSCSLEIVTSDGRNVSINNFMGRGKRTIEIMSQKLVTIPYIEVREIRI